MRFFSMSKIPYFSPYELKTKQGIRLKFCLYAPEVEAIKSDVGISIILLFMFLCPKNSRKWPFFIFFSNLALKKGHKIVKNRNNQNRYITFVQKGLQTILTKL